MKKQDKKGKMKDPRNKIFIVIFTFLGLMTLLSVYMLAVTA